MILCVLGSGNGARQGTTVLPCPAVTLRSAFPLSLSNIALAISPPCTIGTPHPPRSSWQGWLPLCAVVIASLAVGALISLLVTAARGPIAPISPHAAQIGRTSSAERPASRHSDASPVLGSRWINGLNEQDVRGDWSLTASAKFSTRRQSFLALDHSGVARAQSPPQPTFRQL